MKLINDAKEDKVEIINQKEEKREIKFIGSQVRVVGLMLWEFNYKTGVLRAALFKKQDIEVRSLKPNEHSSLKRHKVDVQENCYYFQALNRKNAEKKLTKLLRK